MRPTDEEAQERGFPTAKEWYVQTSTPIRHGLEAARPALEADFETAQQASEPSAASEPASHLWPPVPQEGVEPLDALDTFGPLPAGGGRSGAGGSAGANASDEVFAATFEKYCASEASQVEVLQLLLESGPRPRSLPVPVEPLGTVDRPVEYAVAPLQLPTFTAFPRLWAELTGALRQRKWRGTKKRVNATYGSVDDSGRFLEQAEMSDLVHDEPVREILQKMMPWVDFSSERVLSLIHI